MAEYERLRAVTMRRTTSWDVTPCSPVQVHINFSGTSVFRIGLSYSSTLKAEVIRSSIMLLNFQRTTRRHMPEYSWLVFRIYSEGISLDPQLIRPE
jgi:hypothetical protein